MNDAQLNRFREILADLNLAAYARAVGRPYRTVQDWQRGTHRPPAEAIEELASFLRTRAEADLEAADALEALGDEQASG